MGIWRRETKWVREQDPVCERGGQSALALVLSDYMRQRRLPPGIEADACMKNVTSTVYVIPCWNYQSHIVSYRNVTTTGRPWNWHLHSQNHAEGTHASPLQQFSSARHPRIIRRKAGVL